MARLIPFLKFLILSFLLGLSFSVSADPYNQLLWKTGDSGNWYEWWYFKVVDPQTKDAFFFVYGLVNPGDVTQQNPASRTYVSAGRFANNLTVEKHSRAETMFKPQEFSTNTNGATLSIAGNSFSENFLQGDLTEANGLHIRWNLSTTKLWTYNAMGWTISIPDISNIFWYPAQASMLASGWIEYNGKRYVLKNALAYQDRNWGRSFPKWWAWISCNDFINSPGSVLASGGGRPKILDQIDPFDGYSLGLKHKGHEYIFRVPDGDPIHMDIRYGHWLVDAHNWRNERVVLRAFAPKNKFMILPFVTPQGGLFKDYEALTGDLVVEIYKRQNFFAAWELVDKIESHTSGIEFGSFDDQDFKELFSTETNLFRPHAEY